MLGRFVWPLPWLPAVKVAVCLLVLLASQYHLFSRLGWRYAIGLGADWEAFRVDSDYAGAA